MLLFNWPEIMNFMLNNISILTRMKSKESILVRALAVLKYSTKFLFRSTAATSRDTAAVPSRIEDAVLPQPPGLKCAGRHLAQSIPGQAVQILGCLHLQDRMEMLLGRLHVADQAVKASAHTVSAGPGDRTPWSGADSPWKAYQSRCWSLSKTMHHVIPAVLSCCPLDLGCIYAAIRPIL